MIHHLLRSWWCQPLYVHEFCLRLFLSRCQSQVQLCDDELGPAALQRLEWLEEVSWPILQISLQLQGTSWCQFQVLVFVRWLKPTLRANMSIFRVWVSTLHTFWGWRLGWYQDWPSIIVEKTCAGHAIRSKAGWLSCSHEHARLSLLRGLRWA